MDICIIYLPGRLDVVICFGICVLGLGANSRSWWILAKIRLHFCTYLFFSVLLLILRSPAKENTCINKYTKRGITLGAPARSVSLRWDNSNLLSTAMLHVNVICNSLPPPPTQPLPPSPRPWVCIFYFFFRVFPFARNVKEGYRILLSKCTLFT